MRTQTDTRFPPEVTSSDGDEYEVDSILAKRGKGARTEYLVRWRGWPVWEATWERRQNLAGAADVLGTFKANLQVNVLDTAISTSTPSLQQPQWDLHQSPVQTPDRGATSLQQPPDAPPSPQSATSAGSAVSNRLRAEARDKSRFGILDRTWRDRVPESGSLEVAHLARKVQAEYDRVPPATDIDLKMNVTNKTRTTTTPPPVPASASLWNAVRTRPTMARRSGLMRPSPAQGCTMQLPRAGPGRTGSRR